MVPVKVGDVLEFDALSASKDGGGSSSPTKTEGRGLTTGRVVEVNSEDEGGDGTCTVQVSPYEPLQPLHLRRTFYKVVYEAGELCALTSKMVGWEIELESVDMRRLECGVVKQVDCDINCALVLFAGGRKEWLDLTFFRVKVPGHQPSPGDSNVDDECALGNGVKHSTPVHKHKQSEIWESPKQHNTGDESSEVPDSIRPSSPRDFSVVVSPLSIPHIDPDDFDWHLEGTHVELCNRDGEFLEGAALCSKTKSHLQLYNEDRGFFEVGCSLQGFKVVIHGLDNLKAFPMGQIIDVYSPLIGRFRTGTVLKAAMHGHLIPIRFGPSKAIEWIDLKSQTFKLVFLPHITEAFEHPEESDRSNLHAPRNSREHPPHRSHGHESHRSHYLEYPRLCEGQGIEIFDDQSKQYLKCKVVAQSNWSNEAYVFELAENPAGGASTKHIVSSLSRLRSRLLLQPAQWDEYRRVLVGHRVDVYDRVGKSVMNGKIHAVDGSSAEPAIQVRFKDGHQSWIDLRTNKVKLRMHSASETARIPDEGPTTPQQVSLRTESFSTNGRANEEVASEQASSPFPAVQAAKPDLAPSNLDPSQPLARVPSGEESSLSNTSPALNPASEAGVPATGSSPVRKPSPGKRPMHRRASQSSDVPKTALPAETTESAVLPVSSPIKEETTLAPAVSPIKPLSPLQSPRLDSHQIRPVSPGGPLPPVQPSSNNSSPSKTQLSAQVAGDHDGHQSS